jgi:His-Xaa-Ser system radical SAM maturase HxsC
VNVPVVHSVRHMDHLRAGDVIAITPSNGFVRTVYRPDSGHNILFATERCNSNCLMCSQPPKDVDDTDYFYNTNLEIIKFISSQTTYLTLTGGEPTLLGVRLFNLLAELKRSLPQTHVHMLTNGRSFAWASMARSLANVAHPNLSLGIPLYSDYAPDHDYIVQAKGAFDQTVLGLHQLARWRVVTEIRVVLHKLSIPRLPHLAEYICRNFPFVTHIALMGLEPTGYTPRNMDELWIDPLLYQEELEAAVETLTVHGMNVSIYNSQLCVLRQSLWKFARRSISDWKNIFLSECESCSRLDECGGSFQSAGRLHSAHIRPFA